MLSNVEKEKEIQMSNYKCPETVKQQYKTVFFFFEKVDSFEMTISMFRKQYPTKSLN